MYLKNLSVINYKSVAQANLRFNSKINCFIGDNGVGKTNLLDTIYYLSFCRSYFYNPENLNIKHGEAFFLLKGEYDREGSNETVSCGMKEKQKKKVKRNDKEYKKLSEHIGLLPVVMVSPSDSRLILEGSDERRRYMDGVISQFDREYLDALINHNKLIQQRNTLLKQARETRKYDIGLFEVLDEQLARYGGIVHYKRKDYLKKLIPVFQEFHNMVSLGRESVDIEYISNFPEEGFVNLLKENLQKDIITGYTSIGVHKDDLNFILGEYPIKRIGSQGQQKSFLIALKFAQFEFIKMQSKLTPILLLDDIFDKLDRLRVEAIVKLVAEEAFGQIFITDTNRDHLLNILSEINEDSSVFMIAENGEIIDNKG